MIKGDNTFRKSEVDRLVKYLIKNGNPDIIHLSNALILGLARQLKQRMKIKIVCSLLNEDDWIDDMVEPFRSKAWELIAKEAVHVDSFITPSRYYKELFIKKTGLKGENISIVPLGFDPESNEYVKGISRPPALGYFCRVNYHNGFDKLTDAFIDLKSKGLVPDLTLHICGGFTGDDKPFIAEQIKKIRENGFKSSVRIYPEFMGDKKMEFFNNVDVISVPVRKYDGYGLYILEANGAGIPVVQPATGSFPEIIEITGGGMTYSPDNKEELVKTLHKLLSDADLRIALGEAGRKGVRSKLSLEEMSVGLSEIYNKV
jgi:glycosyltransferase involved in cell wall biosynthesis